MAPEVTDPVPDEEIEALRAEIQSQRVEVRKQLADDLGGEPADYDARKYLRNRADETVVDDEN